MLNIYRNSMDSHYRSFQAGRASDTNIAFNSTGRQIQKGEQEASKLEFDQTTYLYV